MLLRQRQKTDKKSGRLAGLSERYIKVYSPRNLIINAVAKFCRGEGEALRHLLQHFFAMAKQSTAAFSCFTVRGNIIVLPQHSLVSMPWPYQFKLHQFPLKRWPSLSFSTLLLCSKSIQSQTIQY